MNHPDPNGPPPTSFKKTINAAYQAYIVISVLGFAVNMVRWIWEHGIEVPGFFSGLLERHLPSYWGQPSEILFWFCIVALLGAITAFAFVVLILIHFTRRVAAKRRTQSKDSERSPLATCWDAIVETYAAKRFKDLDCLQAGLRASLVFFILVSALASLFQRHSLNTVHAERWIQNLNALHIGLAFCYLNLMAILFYLQRKELIAIEEKGSDDQILYDEKVGAIFWRSARWDLLFVTLIWATTLLPQRPYHLAFILPMMGTWLFLSERARRAFMLVLAALLLHFTILSGVVLQSSQFAKSLGYKDHAVVSIFGDLLSTLAFWGALGVVLAVLRYLRMRSKAALEEESLLRRALETLGVQQKQTVFAKNSKRQFIFANDVLLERLVPIVEKKNWKVENGRARWSDIKGKTDEELGIEKAEYRNSDNAVLHSKSPATDHFEGFEPTFEPNALPGTVIWTRKEAIRENGNVTALVGCVEAGHPIQMQALDQYLTNKLPIYASMKNLKGHIVWANERHLRRLEEKINALLPEKNRDELLKQSLQARLKAIRNGEGPTDVDLYGRDTGLKYQDIDAQIINRARNHQGTVKDFDEEMNSFIKEKFNLTLDEDYPNRGWMEHHRFPGEEQGCWVEVWKMPWWEERTENGVTIRDVKGILVFFEDKDKTYLRRSVVWRWLEDHIRLANEANVRLLQGVSNDSSEIASDLRDFRLSCLLHRMLIWFKIFVDDKKETKAVLKTPPRTSNDLKVLMQLIQEGNQSIVIIELDLPSSAIIFEENGDDFFAIIVAVVMNAVEATLRQTEVKPNPPVIVKLMIDAGILVAEIFDKGTTMTTKEAEKIYNLESVHKTDGKPCGGLLIAKRLAAHLCRVAEKESSEKNSCPYGLFIEPNNPQPGTKVTLRLPMSAFEKSRNQISYSSKGVLSYDL